jgi:hypothetical protein
MNLLTAIQSMDSSGSLADILCRLTDEMLEQFIADYNRTDYKAFTLFAVRLASPHTGVLDATLPSLKRLVEQTIYIVNLEKMRREGLVTFVLPRTILDEKFDLQFRVTLKGREKLAELSAKLP